jgi:hypothetical protein
LYAKGYPLITEQDFNNAIYYRLIISISDNGVHIGNYCIKTHNKEAVQLMNGQFYNKQCEYKVVGYASFYEPEEKRLIQVK